MNAQSIEQQLHYLEEVCISLQRAGFETKPMESFQLPVHWDGILLCRIIGKGNMISNPLRRYGHRRSSSGNNRIKK